MTLLSPVIIRDIAGDPINWISPVLPGLGLRLRGSTSGYVGLKAPASGAAVDFTLPSADGTSGQALVTNASGVLSFATLTTSPAGSSGQIQFNSAGSFGGTTGLVWQASASPHVAITAQSATYVPLRLTLAATPTANAFEVNSSSGSGGNICKISSGGDIYIPGNKYIRCDGNAILTYETANICVSLGNGNGPKTRIYAGQATPAMILDSVAKTITVADTLNFVFNATTGTKLGTATTQKLGFWNAAPVAQPASASQAALTDSTGGTTDGTVSAVSGSGDDPTINNNFKELVTLLNQLRSDLVTVGIIKGAA